MDKEADPQLHNKQAVIHSFKLFSFIFLPFHSSFAIFFTHTQISFHFISYNLQTRMTNIIKLIFFFFLLFFFLFIYVYKYIQNIILFTNPSFLINNKKKYETNKKSIKGPQKSSNSRQNATSTATTPDRTSIYDVNYEISV